MKTTESVLNNLTQTLKNAKFGLDDLQNGPTERKSAGLTNLTVWGRAVTNVLQNLKSIESGFTEWYLIHQTVMTEDPLMKYFYKRRSIHLKQGDLNVARVARNVNFNSQEIFQRFPPPLNNKGFFMGDENGGSGWIIELPDGKEEKLYIELPEDVGSTSIEFIDAPELHMGIPITNKSVENLSVLYYNYLENLVDEAYKEFKK
ncbi:MAG: hypothetical protein ACI9G9_000794 [Psychromonas sp.]|jgi:hypothetical protein